MKKRFLTVCEGGNVRSVSMAYTLKYDHRQDAIAISHGRNGNEALKLLADWADYIVVMQPEFKERFMHVKPWEAKLRVVDVGPDRWMNPLHPELYKIVAEVAQEWSKRGFEI